MGGATFEIYRVLPDPCDMPRCANNARHEIRLIGSPVSTVLTCGRHKDWGKSALIAQDLRQAMQGTSGAPIAGGWIPRAEAEKIVLDMMEPSSGGE